MYSLDREKIMHNHRPTPVLVALAAGPLALSLAAQGAGAQVDLEFRTMQPLADPGDTVAIGLYAVGQPGAPVETVGAVEAVFTWDTGHLILLGVDPSNPANLVFGGFPAAGSGGLNEAMPPADGDGLFVGLGPLGTPIIASPTGTLLAVLNFEATFSTPGADVGIEATGGSPLRETVVYDGTTPNTVVTGTLTGTSVVIRCGPFDLALPYGQLDLADINIFTSAFLATDPLADLNEDGIYDLSDINFFVNGFIQGCPTPP